MPELPSEDLDLICAATRHLWEEARGHRFFFTGGTGFFGIWLLESFLEANRRFKLNAEAVVLTRDPERFFRKCPHLKDNSVLSFHTGDVRSFDFPSGRFEYVIHAATEASAKLSSEQPLEMLSTILDGTKRTLEFARHCGARKFLLTSSGAVYGPQPPDISHIEEAYIGAPDCLDPASVYGEGKRTAELMCVLYSKYFEVKIARCFAFVGPHLPLDAHFAIGNFIRDALAGGPIVIKGDGTPKRSYLYAADLAIWLWTVLFLGKSCRPYNVGSAEAISIGELAHLVRRSIAPNVDVSISGNTTFVSPLTQYLPEIRRAEEELGLSQRIALSEALAKTAGWHCACERVTPGSTSPSF
ncbi:MAG TPA: NAD-dependent epimerase/dehydratase family protein [Terriglobales bacterium]|nr:NAD-dependent epimerase/dehydratase family protein [Terriglobales bacterium]